MAVTPTWEILFLLEEEPFSYTFRASHVDRAIELAEEAAIRDGEVVPMGTKVIAREADTISWTVSAVVGVRRKGA